jgi:hypothetical protein
MSWGLFRLLSGDGPVMVMFFAKTFLGGSRSFRKWKDAPGPVMVTFQTAFCVFFALFTK